MILTPVCDVEPSCDIMINVSPAVLRHWATQLENRLQNITEGVNQHTPVVTLKIASGIRIFCDPKMPAAVPTVIKSKPNDNTITLTGETDLNGLKTGFSAAQILDQNQNTATSHSLN